MRHLKIKGTLVADGVFVEVVEQTHFDRDFAPESPSEGIQTKWHRHEYEPGKLFWLGSMATHVPERGETFFDLMVKPSVDKPAPAQIVPLNLWPVCKSAVESYNDRYKE